MSFVETIDLIAIVLEIVLANELGVVWVEDIVFDLLIDKGRGLLPLLGLSPGLAPILKVENIYIS